MKNRTDKRNHQEKKGQTESAPAALEILVVIFMPRNASGNPATMGQATMTRKAPKIETGKAADDAARIF